MAETRQQLADLIRTWLLYPEDGPDADLEASPDGLPSYAQSIAKFKDNMMMSAEHAEMALLTALDGNGDGQGT